MHGQVVEAWLPHLRVARLVVADDEAAASPLMRSAMLMVVPPELEVQISRVDATDFAGLATDGVRSLLLVRDVAAAVAARRLGLPAGPLNLGNVHAGPGRTQLTRSVFLTDDERVALKKLGMTTTAQAVPGEAAIPLPG